jgi:hypothetical protein
MGLGNPNTISIIGDSETVCSKSCIARNFLFHTFHVLYNIYTVSVMNPGHVNYLHYAVYCYNCVDFLQ